MKKLSFKYILIFFFLLGCGYNGYAAVTFRALAGNASTYLSQGSTNNVVFGFEMIVTGSSYNPQVINISAGANANAVFSGKLVKLNSPTENPNDALTTGLTSWNGSFGNTIQFNGVNTSFPVGTHNFYVVLDVSINYNTIPNTFIFSLPSSNIAQNMSGVSTPTNLPASNTTYNTGKIYNWWGSITSGTPWTNKDNWRNNNGNAVNEPPGTYDQVNIGVQNYVNDPVISTSTVGRMVFGTVAGKAPTVTVNSSLTIRSNITFQSDNWSYNDFSVTIAGPGTVNVVDINAIANTTINAESYITPINSSVNALNISGNINLTSQRIVFNSIYPATHSSEFNVLGGTTTLEGTIKTTNTSLAISTIYVSNGTLKLNNVSALSTLSSLGTNVVSFDNAGSTIEYSRAGAQTVYAGSAITGLAANSISYRNLSFSGSGIKTANGGILTISGNFTNSLANDANNYLALNTTATSFDGSSAQTLDGGIGTGTLLYNTTFTNGGTKTINAGNFSLASTSSLTMSGTTELAAGGKLTLKSDVNGTANVVTIPSTAKITGNVNVERYLSGGLSTSRGYRLLSSPVSVSAASQIIPNLTYITGHTTGSGGPSAGFTAAGNPSMYFFREDVSSNNSSFVSGNYRGLSGIGAGSSFSLNNETGTKTLPAGNGFMFFFRGGSTTVNPTNTSSIAQAATFTSTGYLNQGSISVKHWTTGNNGLLYTNTGLVANSSVRGLNLVGNPYPSAIDWDSFGTSITGTNVSNTIWIYNPNAKAYSSYVTGTGGIGTNSTAQADIIASGQGFFVQATGASPTLTFTENAKTTTTITSGNLRLATDPSAQEPIMQYLRVAVIKDSLNREDALIFFKKDARSAFVQNEDAEYLKGNTIVNMSTMSSDKVALAVNQTVFPKKGSTIVPLNVNIPTTGIYIINLDEIKNIPDMYEIWLKDAYTKDSLDIKRHKTYNFNADVNKPATYGSDRFTLVVRPNPAYGYSLLDFTARKTSATSVEVTWKTEHEGDHTYFTVERSTDGGKTFDIIASIRANDLGNYSTTDRNPVKGQNIYRLKQEDINGDVTYSLKVAVSFDNNSNTVATEPAISVFPNPIRSQINVQVNKEADPALYSITITNSLGRVMKTIKAARANWQDDISNYFPGTYFIQVVNEKDKTVTGHTSFLKL